MKFFKALVQKFTGKPVDWDELEEMLIRSDLGVPMSLRIVEALQKRALTQTITARDVVEVAREEILRVLPIQPALIRPFPAKPKAILIVGVNGTGKTTSTAKLAYYFQRHRHSVLLAAADTFRAAAIEQLAVWAERLKIEMIRGQVQRRSGCALLRSLSIRRPARYRISHLRHRRAPSHQEQSDG